MLMPAHRILETILNDMRRLSVDLPGAGTDGSSAQSILTGLRLLMQRESKGAKAVRSQFIALEKLIDVTSGQLGDMAFDQISELHTVIKANKEKSSISDLESSWIKALSILENFADVLIQNKTIPTQTQTKIMSLLVTFESDDLLSQLADDKQDDLDASASLITKDKLEVYLQNKFKESGLTVDSLVPLAGGFGKETILLSVNGNALNGEFVMRRDIGDNAGLENDCHLVNKEYPVLKAIYETGFPGPDAVWLDETHSLLPGGDFIIMRRSPGEIGGNFFGAQTTIPNNLVTSLAEVLAQLHTLPPLQSLGDLTHAIHPRMWDMTQSQCAQEYINDWYSFWRDEVHSPSPALVSLYGWLFANMPNRNGSPAFLHGDIGFHNFLFDDGKLSAVLDWEFAHIGDPAEELAYVKTTIGASIAWDSFMEQYIKAGGSPVDDQTMKFFQVWAYVRNASAANIIANRFVTGRANDLKLSSLPYLHIPHFLKGALAIISGE